MLSIVFDVTELAQQNLENLKFAQSASQDLNTILISGSADEAEKCVKAYSLCQKLTQLERYATVVDLFEAKKDNTSDWFLLITDKDILADTTGTQFIVCSYNFRGSLEQFRERSFTEHAKKKLIYNELSWLYMDSIANDTDAEVSFLSELFKQYGVRNVLDCCCGVGRHVHKLAECGFCVTGVDASASQIATASKNCAHANASYIVSDVRSFSLSKRYDAAMCMWTTYNYFSQDQDLKAFLSNVAKHLNSGGIFVLDSKNIPILEPYRLYHRRTVRDEIDLTLLIYKRIIGRVQNSQYFYFINNGMKKEFYLDEEFVRFYELAELKELSAKYFGMISAYGDFAGAIYDKDSSKRMITVWRKL